MNDHDALLAAVIAHPDDDIPRLVYADWLDDNGDTARAEFVRVQVELARLGCPDCRPGFPCRAGGACRKEPLRRRERALFDARSRGWFDVDGPHGFAVGLDPTRRESDPAVLGIVSRGFVSEVRLPLAAFVGGECGRCGGTGLAGGELWARGNQCGSCAGTGRTPGLAPALAAHPLTRVVLVGAEPIDVVGPNPPWRWLRATHDPFGAELPDELFEAIILDPGGCQHSQHWGRFYPTRDAALDALSAACLAHVRSFRPEPCTPAPVSDTHGDADADH